MCCQENNSKNRRLVNPPSVLTLSILLLNTVAAVKDSYEKARCEAITIPLCRQLPYNTTVFPNLLNQNQEDAGLEVHQFYPLVKVECSLDLKYFLCSLYVPPCTMVDFPIPPCKSFCQSAKNGCEALMNRFGFQWPDKLDCNLFPEQGPGILCLGRNFTATEPPTTEPATTSESPQSIVTAVMQTEETHVPLNNSTLCYKSVVGRQDKILAEFCKADFVMKVKLVKITSTVKETTYIFSERNRILYGFNGLRKRDLKTGIFNAREMVAPECCNIMKPGEHYLIMGYKNMEKLFISTVHAWSKEVRRVANKFESFECYNTFNLWFYRVSASNIVIKITMGCQEDQTKKRRWVNPLSVLILSMLLLTTVAQVHGPYGGDGGVDSYAKARCEAITIPLCHQLPYNTTIFPNLLNQNQEDAGLEVHQFYPLVKVECSLDLKYFLCSMYAPPCTMVDFPIPPCKSLCQSARNGCEALMNRFGFQWPDKLDCSLFPEQRPGILCVDRNRTANKDQQTLTTTRSPDSLETLTPKVQKDDIAFTCPKEFTVPEKDEEFLGSKNCGFPCPMFFKDPTEQKFARLWIGIWAFICAGSSLFTFLTFVIDTKRFRYPERPIIFLSGCYFMIAVVYIIGFFMDDEIACNQPTENDHTYKEATLTQGAKKEMCTILFMVLYYFTMASSIWWVLLSLTWFLAAGLKWGHEAIERNSQYFHVAAWSIPAVKTIIILTMGEVDGDPLSGVCFTGSTNITALRGFVLAPLIIYLIVGTFFLCTGFIALFRIRTFMKHENTKTDKLEKLMIRIGVFTVLYTVPATIVVACYIYEQSFREQWELRWLSDNCLKYSVVCPHQNEFLPEASRAERPDFTIFMIKYLMLVIVGITSGFWIWSGKTLQSWINFYNKLFSRRSVHVPKKPSEV
ncbi:frizzled-7-B-like [Anneissia japonica]|uniref:frizzled-7-B-like n=1 Tax=Anneissia japonica TaxID=1529436 RepID=UPI00142589BD|nr:frizzled-7-B-like [Anneissia japonica]